MEGKRWEKFGSQKKAKGQQAKKLTVIKCWFM
jgi:hypothetical protein